MRAPIGAGLLAALGTLGCADDPATPDADADAVAVWADDDERIALGFDWARGGLSHEIWLADGEGHLDRRLVGPRPGSIRELYFMRSAGYLLVSGTIMVDGRDDGFVDRIDLDGSATRLFDDTGGTVSFVPSPDGSAIARVRLDDCDELRSEGRGRCVLDVDLLDPATGEPVRAPLHLLFGPMEGVEQVFPDWVFHPSGQLLVSDGNLTYAIGPDGELAGEPAVAPDCFRPRTTSSDISREGRTALWDRFDERLVLTPPEAPGYPDRCFAD